MKTLLVGVMLLFPSLALADQPGCAADCGGTQGVPYGTYQNYWNVQQEQENQSIPTIPHQTYNDGNLPPQSPVSPRSSAGGNGNRDLAPSPEMNNGPVADPYGR